MFGFKGHVEKQIVELDKFCNEEIEIYEKGGEQEPYLKIRTAFNILTLSCIIGKSFKKEKDGKISKNKDGKIALNMGMHSIPTAEELVRIMAIVMNFEERVMDPLSDAEANKEGNMALIKPLIIPETVTSKEFADLINNAVRSYISIHDITKIANLVMRLRSKQKKVIGYSCLGVVAAAAAVGVGYALLNKEGCDCGECDECKGNTSDDDVDDTTDVEEEVPEVEIDDDSDMDVELI